MQCASPHRANGIEYSCQRCLPCRINKRRLWTARLILESVKHEGSLFCTLTYSGLKLPDDNSLDPRHVTLFLKRLRNRLQYPIRYYICGEYGTKKGRPHYHALLFGCQHGKEVELAWRLGYVHVGLVTDASVEYCTKYVTKGMTEKEDGRLNGRHPEFARMSLNPGIGADAVPEIARSSVGHFVDVPAVIRMCGRKWPLGRYLRQRMRLSLNRSVLEPEVASMERAFRFQELQKDDEHVRKMREKRKQSAIRAAVLDKISQSKRGL